MPFTVLARGQAPKKYYVQQGEHDATPLRLRAPGRLSLSVSRLPSRSAAVLLFAWLRIDFPRPLQTDGHAAQNHRVYAVTEQLAARLTMR